MLSYVFLPTTAIPFQTHSNDRHTMKKWSVKEIAGLKNHLCGLETEAQARTLCGNEAQCATRIRPEERNNM